MREAVSGIGRCQGELGVKATCFANPEWRTLSITTFEKAAPKDAEELTVVQIRCFDDDAKRFGSRDKGGPPGYDSVQWQLAAMDKTQYFKITHEKRIIGGIIVIKMEGGHYELGRIYIDPGWQNKGIGQKAIEFLERYYKDWGKWTLGTPSWATRNHHFYEKSGFHKVGEEGPSSEGFVEFRYEKNRLAE